MTTALEFFHLFFTNEMVHDICRHTNSYANELIIAGSHSSYTKADGSWKDANPEEINRLIALLGSLSTRTFQGHAVVKSVKAWF